MTATSAEAVDWQAVTHSLAVPRMSPGQGGTEMLTVGPAIGATQRVHPLPMGPMGPMGAGVDGVVPMQWQPERSAAPSEGAQVRTLAGASSPSGSRAAIVMTIAALLGLVSVGSVLLLVRHGAASRASASPPAAAAVVSVVAPPDPNPVVVMPAPTLAPPALDDVAPVPSATPAIPSAPMAASAPTARPGPRPRSSGSGKPAGSPATPALTDWPGPGF